MHALFNRKECLPILVLKPKEVRATDVLLQMAWIEQRDGGHDIPPYADNFFEELATSTEDAYLKFEFAHLEFAIAFIEKIIQAQKNEKIDSSTLEKLVAFLRPYYTQWPTIN